MSTSSISKATPASSYLYTFSPNKLLVLLVPLCLVCTYLSYVHKIENELIDSFMQALYNFAAL